MLWRRQGQRFLAGTACLLTVSTFFKFFSQPHPFISVKSLTEENAPANQPLSRPPILFVHFHKSAGSSVCDIMRFHQKQVNITDMLDKQDKAKIRLNNCNTELTHPHLNDKEFHSVQTCRMLLPYTMNDANVPFQRNNFLGVEVPFTEPMPCEGFRSFALMREPVSRCLSHFLYEGYSENTVTQWMNRKIKGMVYRDFFVNGYPAVNNMVVRHLLGRARYIDVRPIDDEDFEQAKAQLDLFDAFVPLEHLLHENVLQLLNRTIPEYYEGLMNNSTLVSNKKKEGRKLKYSQHFIERIAKENEYDTKLYNYMLEKLGLNSTS